MSESSRSKTVNISPLPAQTDDYSHYEESTIRWDRVGLAGAIIIAVIYGLYQLIVQDDPETTETVAETSLPTSSKEITLNASSSEKAIDEAVKLEHNSSEMTEQKAPDETLSVSSAEGVEPKTTEDNKATIQEKNEINSAPSETPHFASNDTESTLPSSSSGSAPTTEAPPAQELKTTVSSNAPAIQSYHAGMTQVQLTSMIKDKSPVDELGSSITMNQDGIIKVVLFTEMSQMRGTRTQHIWYRNDIKQATINVPVNTNLQRSSSSKFINAQMLGDWQVKVLDENKTLLAEARFHVSAYQ